MMGFGLFDGCCGWGGSFGAYGWIGLIFNILIIALFVWLIVWAVRRFSSGSGANSLFNQQSVEQSPREILKIRYARGEITREQYQEMLSDLN